MTPRILIRRSILTAGLLAMAMLWLALLQVTHFNAVTVCLGLLFALAVLA